VIDDEARTASHFKKQVLPRPADGACDYYTVFAVSCKRFSGAGII
jgi:hypothetical protein